MFWRGQESQSAAIPIDIYRTLVGLMAIVYFYGLQQEWSTYTAWDGYLDHELIRHIFWFTRIGLYQPWMGDWGRYLLFLSGWACCFGIFLGWRPRLCAFWAWLIATSHLRWNFPVAYLNDSSVIMALFWCSLLPTGTTLVWWKRPWNWSHWRQQSVGDGVCKVFIANLALAYWVTGLTKLTSSYWIDGIALYCALQLNICRSQGWWGPETLPWLMPFNYGAHFLECALPLVFFLRVGHPLRWLGFAMACALHGGIILTIGIEYANACWILSWLFVLRVEIAEKLGLIVTQGLQALRLATGYAAVAISCIALSMSEGVPGMGKAYGVGFALQWSLGLSQEYHLFDWIDRYNYIIRDRSTFRDAPLEGAYPQGLRGFLLQSYLYDMRWMRLPRGQVGEWQRSLKRRIAQRLAQRLEDGPVVLVSDVTRITPTNLELKKWWSQEPARFEVRNHQVEGDI